MESNDNDTYVLVLEYRENVKNENEVGKLSVVSEIDEKDKVKTVEPSEENKKSFMKFNTKDTMLENFFKNFKEQFKDPLRIGIYKVMSDKVVKNVETLKTMLSDKENNKEALAESRVNYEDYLPVQKNLTAIDPEKVDWKQFEDVGLSREKLEQNGDLDKLLLYRQKTNLQTIAVNTGNSTIYTEARLALRSDDDGNIGLSPLFAKQSLSASTLLETFSHVAIQ